MIQIKTGLELNYLSVHQPTSKQLQSVENTPSNQTHVQSQTAEWSDLDYISHMLLFRCGQTKPQLFMPCSIEVMFIQARGELHSGLNIDILTLSFLCKRNNMWAFFSLLNKVGNCFVRAINSILYNWNWVATESTCISVFFLFVD